MRLSASRIRSINRAIARVQVVRLVRARQKPPPHPLANPTLAVSVNAAEFVKVVVVPRSATL